MDPMTDSPLPIPISGGLAGALAKAQAELVNPDLDGQNPHFRSKFATLGACLRAVRPVLGKHGVAIIQKPSFADGLVTVETVLAYGNEQISSSLSCKAGSRPQEVGSGISYLRRYALCAMVGIVGDDDDDGNAAQGRPVTTASPAREVSQAKPDHPYPWTAKLRGLLKETGCADQADGDAVIADLMRKPDGTPVYGGWTSVSGNEADCQLLAEELRTRLDAAVDSDAVLEAARAAAMEQS